jgi:pyocin large subunit-like protein
MKVSEAQTLLCDLVDVGSANLAAEAAHIGEAEIIGNDDKEVGAFGSHVNGTDFKDSLGRSRM